MKTWIGTKRLAVIPAITTGAGNVPANFAQRVTERIFYDPNPITGVDRSLRAYIHAVSYGRAVLDAEIFDPVTVTWARHGNPLVPNPGKTMDDAIAAAGPRLGAFQFVMVVFPAGIPGVNAFAFYGIPQAHSYVLLDDPLGAWAMELLHMVTEFGDLYGPPAGRAPSPGTYDEMDAAAGTHPSAFTKQKMGWIDTASIATVSPQQNVDWVVHPLARLQPPPPGRFSALKVPIPGSANRYILIEAREKLDVYENATPDVSSGIPGEGVVVYDVDESKWPPLWLRANPGLGVGDTFSDAATKMKLSVLSRLGGGGFRLNIAANPLPGLGKDIGIGAEGSVWLIGTSATGAAGDFSVYKWNGADWTPVDGGGVRIAVGPHGEPWLVNSAGSIFRRQGGTWLPMPGLGKDISVGADGSVWLIGTNAVGVGGDFGIHEWNGANWRATNGGGIRIAVGPDGQPWIVNASGKIFHRHVGTWVPQPGMGRDISVGADGSVWLIGTNPTGGAGNFGVYKWNGADWNLKDGASVGVAVAPDGQPWLLNAAGQIFR